jgi:4-hydroxythreonine-4-phosphate dehydrogenase
MSPPTGISLGDPAGIGPEIVVRALALRPDLPAVVFGDRGVLERAAAALNLPAPPASCVHAITRLGVNEVQPGQPNEASGRAQVAYLAAATQAVLRGEVAALVTAPISKEWAGRVGFQFPGHTEYLAATAAAPEHAMMLAGPRLRVTVATTHIALREVPTALTPAGIASTIVLTARALRDWFGLALPQVAVAGLNPHAGEGGRFGDEEARLVVPAIELARQRLAAEEIEATVSGPAVPDAVFRQAVHGAFDAVVALYHDQGLIPIKMLHFDEAVNVTLGLPFVRTSPDHGTAYDIAGTGRARPDSFLAALDLAAAIVFKTQKSSGAGKASGPAPQEPLRIPGSGAAGGGNAGNTVTRAGQDNRDKTPARGTPLDAIRATGAAGARSRGTA